MADWASLLNSPPIANLDTICECDGHILTSNDPRGQSKVQEILCHLPVADLHISDPQIGHKLQAADSTFLSAKQAFLPAGPKSSTSKIQSYGEIFDNFLTNNEESWWVKILQNLAPLQGPKLSSEEIIKLYSSTRDVKNAQVKSLAWHPHVAKLALAMKDDTVQVVLTSSSIKPLLKHKKQKQVACLAWRPYSASELAVGCSSGVLIWTVDPISVVARPSAACVSLLSADLTHHQPVTSVAWNPQGTLLLTCSAADTSMYVWNTASEVKVPLKRIGGGGVHLATWSPLGSAIMAATVSTVFRIWKSSDWLPEKWHAVSGYVNSICWSPCGTCALFTTSTEPRIYSLRFSVQDQIQTAGAAVPVMDLTKTLIDEEIVIGGEVQAMHWDPSGERLVVSFKESNLIALFCTRVSMNSVSVSPLGFIQGKDNEHPSTIEFAKHFKGGALLSIVWSSGRLQHFPMFFMSSTNLVQDLDQQQHCLLSSSPAAEFAPRIFSSPAL